MKKMLLIVDMQNDFITGSLGTEEAKAIVPNVVKKTEEYNLAGYDIFFTQDTHYEDYLETQEGKNLPVTHCIEGSLGHEICNELKKYICDYKINLISKETFGAFDLIYEVFADKDNLETKYDEVELVGLCTDICVISNALLLKSLDSELKVTVDASCCAGVTPETHQKALDVMKMCQVNVINESVCND